VTVMPYLRGMWESRGIGTNYEIILDSNERRRYLILYANW